MKNCLLRAFLLIVLLALAVQSYATETAPVNVRDLIIVGLKNNLGIKVDKLNVSVATEAVISGEAVFDSELFASAGYSESSTPIATSLSLIENSDGQVWSGELGLRKKYTSGLLAALSLDSEWTEDNNQSEDLDPRYRTSLTLSLTQPLLREFGTKINTTNLRITRNQQNQAALQYQLQAQSLALQIEVLASQLAGQSEIVALRSEAVGLANELYLANKRRFDTGVIPISEVQEAETALANRELNHSQALQARDLSFENLNRQLNHSLPAEFDSKPLYLFAVELSRADLPLFEQMFVDAQGKSINLQLAALDIKNSLLQQDFYQNQLKPKLDLKLQAGLNGLSGAERSPLVNSRYAGSWADSFVRTADGDGYQWGAGLEFSVPLGNRSAKAKARQADLQRKQANYRQRDVDTQLRSILQQQSINLKRAYDQVKIAERFERLAKLSLQQEQRRLEEGLSDTFRIISFQDNMITAQVGRINALIQYYSTAAQLSFYRGIILEQNNINLSQIAEEKSLETM